VRTSTIIARSIFGLLFLGMDSFVWWAVVNDWRKKQRDGMRWFGSADGDGSSPLDTQPLLIGGRLNPRNPKVAFSFTMAAGFAGVAFLCGGAALLVSVIA
jgi:hypothetical protein